MRGVFGGIFYNDINQWRLKVPTFGAFELLLDIIVRYLFIFINTKNWVFRVCLSKTK